MENGQTENVGDNQSNKCREDDSFSGWLYRHRHKLSVMLALAFGYTVGSVAGELKTRREYRGIF